MTASLLVTSPAVSVNDSLDGLMAVSKLMKEEFALDSFLTSRDAFGLLISMTIDEGNPLWLWITPSTISIRRESS